MLTRIFSLLFVTGFCSFSFAYQKTYFRSPSTPISCKLSFQLSSIDIQNLDRDYGEPPDWLDNFLRTSPQNRQWAVDHAYYIALKALKRKYPNVIFSKFVYAYTIDNWDDGDYKDLTNPLWTDQKRWNKLSSKDLDAKNIWDKENWDNMHYKKAKTFLCRPKYIDFTKADSVAAMILPGHNYAKYPEHYDVQLAGNNQYGNASYKYCPIEDDGETSMWAHYYRNPRYINLQSYRELKHSEQEMEIFYTLRLEIYPLVFDAGYFFIEPKQYEPDRPPWAESLMEALVFIILHELAHFEIYAENNAKTISNSYIKMTDSENSCDAFAYSLLKEKQTKYDIAQELWRALINKTKNQWDN